MPSAATASRDASRFGRSKVRAKMPTCTGATPSPYPCPSGLEAAPRGRGDDVGASGMLVGRAGQLALAAALVGEALERCLVKLDAEAGLVGDGDVAVDRLQRVPCDLVRGLLPAHRVLHHQEVWHDR